jgi:hypothetical protein
MADIDQRNLSREPTFVLRGEDRHAALLTWLWAELAAEEGEDPEYVAAAERTSVAMLKYLIAKQKKPIGFVQLVTAIVRAMSRAPYSKDEVLEWLTTTSSSNTADGSGLGP